MRNLKKILALVLALVMSFSLMATANAFTDDKDIDATYDEAVTVLSNLKVFQGYENGSFQPKGDITRAEVAAIIYRIVTGDVNDAQVAIYKDYNKFDDVKSTSWYAGYVNYCANAEYIKGYDAKTFGPNDKVTGYQALAMILRAVGYDKNNEFTGAGWQVQVASVAKSLHISDNVTAGTLGGAAPREVVAELLFRSILVPQVTYSAAFGYQNIGVTTGAIANGTTDPSAWIVHNDSIGAETFGLEMISGEISAVGRTAGTTTLLDRSTAANGTTLAPVTVTNTDTPWTDIGYAAYVYTVPTAGTKTREAVSDVVITGQSLAVSTAETCDRSIEHLVHANSVRGHEGERLVTLNVDARGNENYHVYYNGRLLDSTFAAADYWFDTADMVVKYGNNAVEVVNGLKVDFIDNDNGGRAEAIVFTEYTSGQVVGIANENNTGNNAYVRDNYYINAWSNTAGNAGRIAVKNDNLVTEDELAVGTVVTYVQYAGDTYVTAAPITTGKFTKINYNVVATAAGRTETSYVIGDQTYVKAFDDTVAASKSAYLQDYYRGMDAALDQSMIRDKEDLDVYTDPYGYIIYVTKAAVTTNYLYVVRANHSDTVAGTTYATVAFPDGTVENVYVSEDSQDRFNQNIKNDMYSYTVEDGVYKLKTYCGTYTNDNMAHTAGINFSNGDIKLVDGAYLTTTSTVVDLRGVIEDRETSATVYTGRDEVPSLNNATFHYVTDGDGFVTLAFITAGEVLDSKSFVVYHTQFNSYGLDSNGKGTYSLSVISGGEIETVTLSQNQYNYITELGVGLYTFDRYGNLKNYTAFNEGWYDGVWQNNTLLVKDSTGKVVGTYSYADSVNFWVLDIEENKAEGAAYKYGMIWGEDVKVYVVSSGSKTTDIYVIKGALADTAGDKYTVGVAADNGARATIWSKANVTMKNAVTDVNELGQYAYYKLNGYVTRAEFEPYATYDVVVDGTPSWEDLDRNTVITLPKTAANPATQTEYVKIEATDAEGNPTTEWKEAGTKYTVTSDTAITTGYYAFKLNGVTYYTTAGDKAATTLIADAVAQGAPAATGTYYKYTWDVTAADGDEGELILSAADAADTSKGYLNASTYDVAEVTTGYFEVTVSGSATKEHKVLSGALYNADGTVAFDADTETTAPAVIVDSTNTTTSVTPVYAQKGTVVVSYAGTTEDARWTVNDVDVTITLS